jgi:hypothetical protein
MSNNPKAVIANIPAELLGLSSWTHITADMVLSKNDQDGSGVVGQRIFMDVAYRVAQNQPSNEGYYFLVGGLTTPGSPGVSFPQVAVFSGSSPLFSYSLDTVGLGGPGFTDALYGVACVAPGATSTFPKIVATTFHGTLGGLSLQTSTTDSATLETQAAWTSGGASLGAGSPVVGWQQRVAVARDATTNYFYNAGKKTGAAGSTKAMARKLYTTNDTTAWTAITVPDAGNSDGYTKLVVSRAGHVMALTDFGTIDVGDGVNPTAFFTDTASNARDIAYSHRTNKFYRISNLGNVASTTAGSWSNGGPVTWTNEYTGMVNGGSTSPALICPLEIPYQSAGDPSLATATEDAWFIIYHSDSKRTFATRDWAVFYPVSIPGLFRSNINDRRFPVNSSYMKFAGERLFVFSPRGLSISGPLGIRPMYNMG